MKIRMRMSVAGTFHGIENVQIGDVVDVPDDDGARYCNLGYAEPAADKDDDVETAVPADDAETRDADPATVRAWAKEQGIDVPSRGKIPGDVLEQYKASAGE